MATEFSATPLTGQIPLTVAFTDESTPTPTSWTWSFGDGSVSKLQNPTHVYSAPGNYTVRLRVDENPVLEKENYISTTYPPGASHKIQVQSGNIYYSASDPANTVNMNIKGQLSVDTQLSVGNSSIIGGTITTDPGQDLTITPEGNLRLSPNGALMLNNSVWPFSTVSSGQFLGSSAGTNLEFISLLLGISPVDNLTQSDLNLSWPDAKPGQWIIGPSKDAGNYVSSYQNIGPGQWIKLFGTGGGGGGGGTVTSVGIASPNSTLQILNSPILTSGNIVVDLSTTTVVSGSYTNADITVDSYGRITSATSGTSGTLTSVGITSPNSTLQISNSPITSSGNISIDLPITAVVSGSYTNANLTIDSYGRITNAENGTNNTGPLKINNQTGNYTLQLSDAENTLIRVTSNTPAVVTIPNDSVINFPIGAAILVGWSGIGQVSIAAASGVTISTPYTLNIGVQNGKVVLFKVAANSWEVEGNLHT